MSKCKSCGKQWVDHYGTEITCRHLQACISALKAIHIWETLDREHGHRAHSVSWYVTDIIERKFDEIGVKYGK
jgi:transposase-like protein